MSQRCVVVTVSPAEINDPIEMSLGRQAWVDPRNYATGKATVGVYKTTLHSLGNERIHSSRPPDVTHSTQQGPQAAAMRTVATIIVAVYG